MYLYCVLLLDQITLNAQKETRHTLWAQNLPLVKCSEAWGTRQLLKFWKWFTWTCATALPLILWQNTSVAWHIFSYAYWQKCSEPRMHKLSVHFSVLIQSWNCSIRLTESLSSASTTMKCESVASVVSMRQQSCYTKWCLIHLSLHRLSAECLKDSSDSEWSSQYYLIQFNPVR